MTKINELLYCKTKNRIKNKSTRSKENVCDFDFLSTDFK